MVYFLQFVSIDITNHLLGLTIVFRGMNDCSNLMGLQ